MTSSSITTAAGADGGGSACGEPARAEAFTTARALTDRTSRTIQGGGG